MCVDGGNDDDEEDGGPTKGREAAAETLSSRTTPTGLAAKNYDEDAKPDDLHFSIASG